MRRVFVDTGGFVALLVVDDASHERAKALFETALHERWQLVTTNVVVIETYSVILHRARNGRQVAMAFLGALATSASTVTSQFVGDDRAQCRRGPVSVVGMAG